MCRARSAQALSAQRAVKVCSVANEKKGATLSPLQHRRLEVFAFGGMPALLNCFDVCATDALPLPKDVDAGVLIFSNLLFEAHIAPSHDGVSSSACCYCQIQQQDSWIYALRNMLTEICVLIGVGDLHLASHNEPRRAWRLQILPSFPVFSIRR